MIIFFLSSFGMVFSTMPHTHIPYDFGINVVIMNHVVSYRYHSSSSTRLISSLISSLQFNTKTIKHTIKKTPIIIISFLHIRFCSPHHSLDSLTELPSLEKIRQRNKCCHHPQPKFPHQTRMHLETS